MQRLCGLSVEGWKLGSLRIFRENEKKQKKKTPKNCSIQKTKMCVPKCALSSGRRAKVREMRAKCERETQSSGQETDREEEWRQREYGDLREVVLISKWLRGPVTWH